MGKIIDWLEKCISAIGRQTAWLTTVLVLLICADVFLRYAFSITRAWVIELEWHIFALIFLLASSWALQADQHVRVDLFYSKWPVKRKALVDLTGTILFLIPWCIVIIATAFKYAENSFVFRETSPDPGGLSARYIIKFAIVIGFVLLLLQAISTAYRSVQILVKRS